MTTRAPIDLTKGCRPRNGHLDTAAWMIDRSGLAPPLQALINKPIGRPRVFPDVRAMLIVMAANGMIRGHKAKLVSIGRVIDALSPEERHELGFPSWDGALGYKQIQRFFTDLNDILAGAPLVEIGDELVVLDHQEFLTRIIEASVPDDLPVTKSVAVDGTDLETWGALHGDPDSVDDTGPEQRATRGKRGGAKRKVKVHGVGPDNRNIYTADRDARGGHRSATNSRSAGEYVGYELHLAVQARDVTWTNYLDQTRFGPEAPNLILAAKLAPAGSYRAEAVVPILKRMRRIRPDTVDLLLDQGYSYLRAVNMFGPVRAMGYRPVFELHPNQRGVTPLDADAHLLDGGLFSPHLPDDYFGEVDSEKRRYLPMPTMSENAEKKRELQQRFNLRARYRYSVLAGPDADGYRRLQCPFCAKRAKALELRSTTRTSAKAPILTVKGSPEKCCQGTITVSAKDLILWQDIPFGTTAWFMSYRRRNCVESVNSALKGQFVDLDKGYHAFTRADRLTIFLAFTLAGVNIDRADSYRAKHQLRPAQRYCRRRRTATLDHVMSGA